MLFQSKDLNLINKEIVAVDPIKVEEFKGGVTYYQDARSAAFYAMGRAIKSHGSVILLIPGDYLANIYTALTEAWFQKANIVVVALHTNLGKIKTVWADRCILTNLTLEVEEFSQREHEIKECFDLHGPALINILYKKMDENKNDYSDLINAIIKIKKDAKFICYNSINNSIDNVIDISVAYKYGVLSKYIGMSAVKECGYLLCDASCVMVDVNIFRTRYANKNMKIIIIDDGRMSENSIKQWISGIGWECKCVPVLDNKTAKWFVDQCKQTVIILYKNGGVL